MKKTNTQPIGGIIMEFLRASGLETPLYEHRLISAWPEVVGPVLSQYTKDLKIYNQVLYVTVSSAAVRNELMMRRTELTRRLNAKAGAQTITHLVLK